MEFLVDSLDVGAYRRDLDVQLAGDLLVGQAGHQEVEDFLFARPQSRVRERCADGALLSVGVPA